MAMAERSTPEQLAELHQEMRARYMEEVRKYYSSDSYEQNNRLTFHDYQTWLEIEFESLEEILNS